MDPFENGAGRSGLDAPNGHVHGGAGADTGSGEVLRPSLAVVFHGGGVVVTVVADTVEVGVEHSVVVGTGVNGHVGGDAPVVVIQLDAMEGSQDDQQLATCGFQVRCCLVKFWWLPVVQAQGTGSAGRMMATCRRWRAVFRGGAILVALVCRVLGARWLGACRKQRMTRRWVSSMLFVGGHGVVVADAN